MSSFESLHVRWYGAVQLPCLRCCACGALLPQDGALDNIAPLHRAIPVDDREVVLRRHRSTRPIKRPERKLVVKPDVQACTKLRCAVLCCTASASIRKGCRIPPITQPPAARSSSSAAIQLLCPANPCRQPLSTFRLPIVPALPRPRWHAEAIGEDIALGSLHYPLFSATKKSRNSGTCFWPTLCQAV